MKKEDLFFQRGRENNRRELQPRDQSGLGGFGEVTRSSKKHRGRSTRPTEEQGQGGPANTLLVSGTLHMQNVNNKSKQYISMV
jgi:hypothetical protein